MTSLFTICKKVSSVAKITTFTLIIEGVKQTTISSYLKGNAKTKPVLDDSFDM